MNIVDLVVTFTVMLLLALLAIPVARWLRLPLGGVLVVLGFVVSELVIYFGYDTGISWRSFRDLVLYVLLPVLVFASALRVDTSSLKRYLGATLSLALPLLLVATGLCTALLYVFVDHATGFPWIAAGIGASLFVATDSLVISEILDRRNVPAPVTTLLEGEGAFGDAIAVALYASLTAYALANSSDTTTLLGRTGLLFLWAVGAGLVAGWLTGKIMRLFGWQRLSDMLQSFVTLVVVYSVYLVTELLLQASGVVALMVAGLLLGSDYRGRDDDSYTRFVYAFWKFLGKLCYVLLFVLVGVTITVDMFQERWLVMLMAIAALLLARLPVILLSLPLQNRLLGSERLNAVQGSILYLGGVRGAVTLALALSLPVELPYWWTIQSMAYGVVLFSLFVQAPLVEFIVNRYRDKL
ncbi:MAG: cation:proton antiporter [Gammaproteobacteria bacterium]